VLSFEVTLSCSPGERHQRDKIELAEATVRIHARDMQEYSLVGLLSAVSSHPAFEALARAVREAQPGGSVGPLGLPEPSRPVMVAALVDQHERPVLWITSQPDEARVLAESLRAYLADPQRLHLLPAPDPMPFERIPWDPATREQRMATLAALHRWTSQDISGPPPIVVAPVRGLMVRTIAPALFSATTMYLQVGDNTGVTDLTTRLAQMGYEIVATVTKPGQFAHRGGIVDIFPPADRMPTRIEWFGDEIDSLRRFDTSSQRSRETAGELLVVPAAEALSLHGEQVATAVESLRLGRMHPIAETEVRTHIEHLRAGEPFAGIEFFAPLLHPEGATALDFFPHESLCVVGDAVQLAASAQGVIAQASTVRAEQIEAGELPPDWPGEPLVDWTEIEARCSRMTRVELGSSGASDQAGAAIADSFTEAPRFGGRVEEAVLDVARMSEGGDSVVVVSRQAPRFVELLADVGVHLAALHELRSVPGPGGLAVVHGALGAGWTFDHDSTKLVILTDSEIFGWRTPHRRHRPSQAGRTSPADHFSELTPGENVVHIEHGIGVFRGLTRMRTADVEREYLQIEYAQGDMLYVPTHQADRVARYIGVGDVEPSITRLGTADWERAKKRARRAVEDIARELLEFYARREIARRTPFASDTPWQAEMEAAFPYFETEDQLRAIDDVKRDMEGDRPMDRLVVGDVGFGKTEVALRAAFKAVMSGKQVAILSPTTVLAQQHYSTFKRRMAPFPVRVATLSRFLSRKEQADVIDRLATREVDIVIGTHRLLSPDVRFKDLGLLIVDEEHRFGVKHKERLRKLSEGVDTLTLTATPIPRTLHMALSGLRDLTMIDSPPDDRLPIVTHVGPQDDNLVRQAVRREIARGGQVFYVFDRVRGIEMVAAKVHKLVPEARVGIAHGQMKESELAHSMLDFVAGAIDVLVCTSIIESGLDIQNANTLIVERAHRFGLAQLHQLRGRVGRGAQRAYAYFLYPPGYELPPEAKQRLTALAEAKDLGAGFRLALRDLEIRGAGEILGSRQHGQVTAVGLDLYTRLLAEAIKKLQADEPRVSDTISREIASVDPGTLPTIDLPVDAHLPEDYIGETSERTRLYRRMAAADDLETVLDIERELVDRFGPTPPPAANLLSILWLRVLAHMARARSVGFDGHRAVVLWPQEHSLRRSSLKLRLGPETRIGRHQLSIPISGSPEEWLTSLRKALEAIAEVEGAL